MHDPYNVVEWINSTDWLDVEGTKEYKLATEVHRAIAEAFPRVPSLYLSWHDQAFRSSQSVIHNYCEAMGKGMGWYSSALLIARGEAYETMAGLHMAPSNLLPDDIKEKQKELLKLLSTRIQQTPPKPDKTWRK